MARVIHRATPITDDFAARRGKGRHESTAPLRHRAQAHLRRRRRHLGPERGVGPRTAPGALRGRPLRAERRPRGQRGDRGHPPGRRHGHPRGHLGHGLHPDRVPELREAPGALRHRHGADALQLQRQLRQGHLRPRLRLAPQGRAPARDRPLPAPAAPHPAAERAQQAALAPQRRAQPVQLRVDGKDPGRPRIFVGLPVQDPEADVRQLRPGRQRLRPPGGDVRHVPRLLRHRTIDADGDLGPGHPQSLPPHGRRPDRPHSPGPRRRAHPPPGRRGRRAGRGRGSRSASTRWCWRATPTRP